MQEKLNIYIGYDTNNDGQQLAFEICRKSLLANCKTPEKLEIVGLNKKELTKKGYFYRKDDKLAATEFTYTRFLSPFLNSFEGICVFCDSDFLWQCDILHEFQPYIERLKNENKAVCCVQHNHVPKENVKMDGRAQTTYPRKNWSSMIIFNCSHPDVRNLTVENVNTQSASWLHRFQWCHSYPILLDANASRLSSLFGKSGCVSLFQSETSKSVCQDENIIGIPHTYNYLVGVYDDEKNPKAIHYTDGGPWHYLYRETEFAENWRNYLDETQKERLKKDLERQEVELDEKK